MVPTIIDTDHFRQLRKSNLRGLFKILQNISFFGNFFFKWNVVTWWFGSHVEKWLFPRRRKGFTLYCEIRAKSRDDSHGACASSSVRHDTTLTLRLAHSFSLSLFLSLAHLLPPYAPSAIHVTLSLSLIFAGHAISLLCATLLFFSL